MDSQNFKTQLPNCNIKNKKIFMLKLQITLPPVVITSINVPNQIKKERIISFFFYCPVYVAWHIQTV